jgi:hypothetical protein
MKTLRHRHIRRPARLTVIAAGALLVAACGGSDESGPAAVDFDRLSIQPTAACTMAGIGAARLTADATVTILEVTSGTTGPAAADRAYCLVKTRVGDNVNITAARVDNGAVTRTRPLCPYPQVARHTGSGSTDDAANFRCTTR